MEQFEILLREIDQYIRAHKEWIIPFVFLISLAESTAVLSWAISTLVFFAAISVAANAYGGNLVPLALASSLGAGCGFWLSYWLGLVLGPHVGDYWPFKRNPHWLVWGHAFFEKWGALGVFLGHFFPPARGAIATVAGVVRMPFIHFQLANWVASFIWGFAVLYSAGRIAELVTR